MKKKHQKTNPSWYIADNEHNRSGYKVLKECRIKDFLVQLIGEFSHIKRFGKLGKMKMRFFVKSYKLPDNCEVDVLQNDPFMMQRAGIKAELLDDFLFDSVKEAEECYNYCCQVCREGK